MKNELEVIASRWAGGWELAFNDGTGEAFTQSRTLAGAAAQVRDYLDTVCPEVRHDDWVVSVMPQLGKTLEDVNAAKAASEAARQATVAAAAQMREVVQELRSEGLSLSDTAAVLGVSRARAQQLVSA